MTENKILSEILHSNVELQQKFKFAISGGPYEIPKDFESRYSALLTDISSLSSPISPFKVDADKKKEINKSIRELVDEGGLVPMIISNYEIFKGAPLERNTFFSKWKDLVEKYNDFSNSPSTYKDNNYIDKINLVDPNGKKKAITIHNYEEWKGFYGSSVNPDNVKFNNLTEDQKKQIYSTLVFSKNNFTYKESTVFTDIFSLNHVGDCNALTTANVALMMEARNADGTKKNNFKTDDFSINIYGDTTHANFSVKGITVESTNFSLAQKEKPRFSGGVETLISVGVTEADRLAPKGTTYQLGNKISKENNPDKKIELTNLAILSETFGYLYNKASKATHSLSFTLQTHYADFNQNLINYHNAYTSKAPNLDEVSKKFVNSAFVLYVDAKNVGEKNLDSLIRGKDKSGDHSLDSLNAFLNSNPKIKKDFENLYQEYVGAKQEEKAKTGVIRK